MAPRRPVLFESQYSLGLVTVLVLLGSIALVGYVLVAN